MVTKIPPPLQEKDYRIRDDDEYLDIECKILELDMQIKTLTQLKEIQRQKLIKMSNDEPCRGKYFKLNKIVSCGRIKYESIPELATVNVDAYRGDPIISYRMDRI